MAGTIYEDFIKSHMPETTTDKRASDIMKLIVVVLGIVFMGIVFLVQFMGAILQLSIILGGIIVGPILALFALGMTVPQINEKVKKSTITKKQCGCYRLATYTAPH